MIKISPPQPEDAEGINDVIKSSWYVTYITPEIGITKKDIDLMYAQSEKQQIEVFRQRAEHPKDDDISLIAKDGEKVVGFIRLKVLPDHVRVRSLYVHPEYTGRGVGTNLWEESKKYIPHDRPIIAWPAEHTKSVGWYKKMGFVETGEKELDTEAMQDSGTRMSVVKMEYKFQF